MCVCYVKSKYVLSNLLLGSALLDTLSLQFANAITFVLLEFADGTIFLGTLLQGVEGNGQQLVALTLGITQLEAIEIVQLGALKVDKTKFISDKLSPAYKTNNDV